MSVRSKTIAEFLLSMHKKILLNKNDNEIQIQKVNVLKLQ